MRRKSSVIKKDAEPKPSPKEGSVMLYSTDDTCPKFEDYKIVRLIGRGTFGKVFLVQNQMTKTFYAMKSIRKDIVIDHDSLESLKVEKLILLQVRHPFIISMN